MRDFFLGGASPAGFETAFWHDHQNAFGFYLKGGPGTGKSTLLKKLAAAFSAESVSVYHCASDPHSLDAVVLEDRGIFAADATAPHEASTPLPGITGCMTDLAEGLHADLLLPHKQEIFSLYQENQAAHACAKKGFAGIGAMEDAAAEIGLSALDHPKLLHFARRFAKRLLPADACAPAVMHDRQAAAITPLGRCMLIPDGFDRILLQDPAFAASEHLLQTLADAAANAGVPCEITRSQTRTNRPPVLLLLPSLHLAVITDAADDSGCGNPEPQKPVSVIRMQRFYDPAILRDHRNLLRFCRKTAGTITAQTVKLLMQALRIHDALESYYIRAIDHAFLDAKADAIISAVTNHRFL